MTERVELSLDRSVCQGTGYCEQLLPALFQVAGDGIAHVLRQPAGEQEMRLASQAEELCPTRAILLRLRSRP